MGRQWLSPKSWSSMMVAVLLVVDGSRAVVPEGHRSRRAMKAVRDRASGHSSLSDHEETKTAVASQTQVGAKRSDTARGDDSFAQHGQVDEIESDEEERVKQQKSRPAAELDDSAERLMLEEKGAEGKEEVEAVVAAKRAPPQASGPGAAAIAASVRSPSVANSRTSAHIAPASRTRSDARLGATTSTRKKLRTAAHAGTRTPASGGSLPEGLDGGKERAQGVRRSTGLQPAQGAVPRTVQFRKTVSTSRPPLNGSVEEEAPGDVASLRVEDMEEGREGVDRPTMGEAERENRAENTSGEGNGDGKSDGVGAQPVGPEGSSDVQDEDVVEQEQGAVSDQLVDEQASMARKEKLGVNDKMPAASHARPGASSSTTADRVESNEPGKMSTLPGPEVVAYVAVGGEEPAVAKKPSVTATEEQDGKAAEEGVDGGAQEEGLVKLADEGRAQEENREQQPPLQQEETEEDEEKGTIGGEQGRAEEGETTADFKRTKGKESVQVGPLKHGAAKAHTSAGSLGMREGGVRPLSGGDGVNVAEAAKGGDGVKTLSASASLSEDELMQFVSVQPALEGDDQMKTSAKVRRTAAVSKLRRRPDVDDDATIPSNTLRRSKVYRRPVQKEQEMLEEPGTKKHASSAEYATTTGPLESSRTMPALSQAERTRPAKMELWSGTAVEDAQEGQPEGDDEFDNLDVEARASTQKAQPIDAAHQRTMSTITKDAMGAAAQGQREAPQGEKRQARGSDELGLPEEDQDEDVLEDGEDDFDMEEVMEDEEEDDLVAATMADSDAKSVKKALPTTAEKGEDAQELVNLNDSKQTLTLSKSKGALGAAAQGKKEAPLQQDRRDDDNDEGDLDALLDSAASTEEEDKAEDGEDEADAELLLDEEEVEEGDGEPVVKKKAMRGKTAKHLMPKVAERGDTSEEQLLSSTAAKERTRPSTRKGAARAGAHAGRGAPVGPDREADDNEEVDLNQNLKAGQDDHDEADAQQREHELDAEDHLEEELFIAKKATKPVKKALSSGTDKGNDVDEEPTPMDGVSDKTTPSKSKDAVRATASGKKVAAETQDTQAEDDEEVDLDEILQMVEDGDEDEAQGEEADADIEGILEPEGEDELVVTTRSAGKTLPKARGKATENEPSAEGSTIRQKEKGALNTVTASATESVKPDSSKAVPPATKGQQGRRSGSKTVGVGRPLKEGGDGPDVEEEGEGDGLSTLQTAFELPEADEQEDGEAPLAAGNGRKSAQSDGAKKTKKSRSPLADAEDDTTLLSAAVSLLANEASATGSAEHEPAAGNKETMDASRPASEAGTKTRMETGKGAAREEKPKDEFVDTSKATPKANPGAARRYEGDTEETNEPLKGETPNTPRVDAVGGKGPAGPAGRANDKKWTAQPPNGKSVSTPLTPDGGKKGAEEKEGGEPAPPQPVGPKGTLGPDDATKKAHNQGPVSAEGPKPRGPDSAAGPPAERKKESGGATPSTGESDKQEGPSAEAAIGEPDKQEGPSAEAAKKAAQPPTAPLQPDEPATEKKPREDEALDIGKPQQDPLVEGRDTVVRPPASTDNTNKAPEVVKDTKKAKAEVKAKATTTCDPTKTCHGHGTCDDDGRCFCRAPWSGPSCLHNDCVDFEDCEGCVTSTVPGGTALLGCYWQDDECRGDGLYAPDMESCSGIGTWARIWSYLQYAVIGFVVVGFASLLIVRSRRPGGFTLFRNIATGYQPIPMNGGAPGQQGREDWNWDPEEDNVELLATSGQGDEARPEPYTDKPPQQQQQSVDKHNGIYSMIKTPAVEKPIKDTSAGPPVSTSTTASTNKPSSIGDDDIFAELGMEVVPNFKTSPTAQSPRESASAGPSAASAPTTRSNRLGLSPIKTSVRDEEAGVEDQAAGWNDDDDIDGILDA